VKSNIYSLFSAIFLAIGFIFLFNSASTITGHAIVEKVSPISSSIFSIYFFAGAIWFSYLANKRKGQAATEFLMTYGWAIIIIIIILGILVYLGIFSGKKTCDNVVLSPPFVSAGSAYNGIEYSIQVVNTAPANVLIVKAEIGTCSSDINKGINYGDTALLTIPCLVASNEDQIKISYMIEGSSLAQISQGKICLVEGGVSQSPEGGEPVCGNGGLCSENSDCNLELGEVCVANLYNGVVGSCVESGEQCDDGYTISGDGCSNICLLDTRTAVEGCDDICLQTCGNGAMDDTQEQCDDANIISGDGCSTHCQVELGYACIEVPSQCYLEEDAICGNGAIEGNEQCDDGNVYGQDGCDEDCQIEQGYACIWEPPSRCNWITCGDGLIQGSEECDDGDLENEDGCSNGCQVESGYTCDGQPSVCAPVQMYYLTTTVNGIGEVFCNGVSCQEQYPELTTVILTAEPPENFISWSGDCSIMQGEICSVTMDNDKDIIAEFSR